MAIMTGFGKAKVAIEDDDLPLREFTVKSSDLVTRVAIFKFQENSWILVSLEMTSLTNRDVNSFKRILSQKTAIPEENIWISVTHTFSAPHLKHTLSTKQDIQEYQLLFKLLKNSLLQALVEAQNNLADTCLKYGSIYCPININRNVETPFGWWLGDNLAGFSNHVLQVLVCESNNSRNVIYNFDLQSSVLDHLDDDQGKRPIDGDVFGETSRELEEKNFSVAIALLGAAGDQQPIFRGRQDESFLVNKELITRQGQLLRTAVLQTTLKEYPVDELKIATSPIELPGQKRQKDTFDIKPSRIFVPKPTTQTVKIKLQAVKFGKIIILGTQPELNSEFGIKCRKIFKDKKVFLGTLIDGGVKYLPEKADFEKITYEAMNTEIGPKADEVFLNELEKLSRKLDKE